LPYETASMFIDLQLEVATDKENRESPQKPSNIKKISWPSGKQDFPDKKYYIPVPDVFQTINNLQQPETTFRQM